MLLTEFGKQRSTQVLRPKFEAAFDLLVEPNPVCGLVSYHVYIVIFLMHGQC